MGKIKQLPPEIAQQVAAGEVVERPANIIKELIENSLDADATHITISIEDGGKQLIRIRDNGCGMSLDDAQLCFSAHATSKLSSVDEIQTVATYGFRGEALASISSVAKVTLKTKETNALEGTAVTIEGGITKSVESTACQVGTDIVITDLFYQIPARKKFLKKAATEFRHIQQLFYANCFQFLSVHFTLINEGKTVYNCPPVKTLSDRFAQLNDHEQTRSMLTFKTEPYHSIVIDGLMSNHQIAKYDRSQIYLFVNKRWIKNNEIARAFIRGYQNVLPPSKFPTGIINITIDPHEVDSNIHPRKEEVKFLHPRRVEQQLTQAVKHTLEQNVSEHIATPVQFNSFAKYQYGTSFIERNPFAPTQLSSTEKSLPQQLVSIKHSEDQHAPESFNFDQFFNATDAQPFAQKHEAANEVLEKQNDVQSTVQSHVQEDVTKSYRFIGNYNKTYILAEHENTLVLIDQHAAHERVLYEQFKNRFEDIAQITLLFPQMIACKKDDLDTLEPHLQLFHENGFTIERFDEHNLVVNATPVHVKNISLEELVQETIASIKTSQSLPKEELYKKTHHNLRAQMACKAAVKAGDSLTEQQMIELLSDLSVCDNRLTCPHGRPTTLSFQLYEIEKKFKRRL